MYQPGDLIAGWIVDEVLGMGMSTVVVRCHRDVLPERVVVLKVLHDAAGVREIEDRFMDGASRYYRLDHPNVAKLQDAQINEGDWFLVTDWVQGRPVDQVRATEGPFSRRRLVDLAEQITGALAAAHKLGLAHRDVRPANVLITEDGSARLVDWGSVVPKKAGLLIGRGLTPDIVLYTPPEWLSREPDPVKWDLYSLGVLLYTMLTGAPPELPATTGNEQQQLLRQAAALGKKDSFDPGPDHPDALRELVTWLTQADPTKRPEDFHDVIYALDDLLGETEVAVMPLDKFKAESKPPVRTPAALPASFGAPEDEFTDDDTVLRRMPQKADAPAPAPPPPAPPPAAPAPPAPRAAPPSLAPSRDESLEVSSVGWVTPALAGTVFGAGMGAIFVSLAVLFFLGLPTDEKPKTAKAAAPAPAAAAATVAPTAPSAAPAPPPAPTGPVIKPDELPADYDARKDGDKAFLAIDPPEGVKVDVYFLRDGEAPAKLPWKAPFSGRDREMRPFFPGAVRGIQVVNDKAGIDQTWDPHTLKAGEGQRWVLKAP